MSRMPLHPASGGAAIVNWAPKTIRFVRYGCANRPFYHLIVINTVSPPRAQPIEQIGSYDPCVNQHNEKLMAFNFERIQYWLGQGNVSVAKPVARLLGLCGFFPIHPTTYMTAWRNRRAADEAAAQAEKKDSEEATAS